MGRYQWELFVVIGFGWASDNLWPIVTSLDSPTVILRVPPVQSSITYPSTEHWLVDWRYVLGLWM